MISKRTHHFCILFLCVFFIVCPSHACFEEAHEHENGATNPQTSFSVSKRCETFFSQPNYTYSFSFVDERDKDILKTLDKVFGSKTHSTVTQGTYSISVDYDPSPESSKVYQQTRYLVSSDELSQKSISRDGYRLFSSGSGNAPKYYQYGGGTYHMENALMASLEEDNDVLLEDIFEDVPENSKILGVCVKLYSSYDCCSPCRWNVLKHVPNFQKIFDTKIRNSKKKFKLDKQPIPFMVNGLMVRTYGIQYNTYTDGKCKSLKQPDYWTALFDQEEYLTFAGRIDGSDLQTMMPVYILKQPKTYINLDKTITLKDENN